MLALTRSWRETFERLKYLARLCHHLRPHFVPPQT
jgi:hypothetical protein